MTRKYIILNPNFDEIDAIMRTYINKQNEKYVQYDVRCVVKVSTTTNRFRYIRLKAKSSLEILLIFLKI